MIQDEAFDSEVNGSRAGQRNSGLENEVRELKLCQNTETRKSCSSSHEDERHRNN